MAEIHKTIGGDEIGGLLKSTYEFYSRFKEFKMIHPQDIPSLQLFKLSPNKNSPQLAQKSSFMSNFKTENLEIPTCTDQNVQDRSDTPRFALSNDSSRAPKSSSENVSQFELTLSKGLDFSTINLQESDAKSPEMMDQVFFDQQAELDIITESKDSLPDSMFTDLNFNYFDSIQDTLMNSEKDFDWQDSIAFTEQSDYVKDSTVIPDSQNEQKTS